MGPCILIYMLYIPNTDEAIQYLLGQRETATINAEHFGKLRKTRIEHGPGHSALLPVDYYDRQIAKAEGKKVAYEEALNVLFALVAAQERTVHYGPHGEPRYGHPEVHPDSDGCQTCQLLDDLEPAE